MHAHFPGHLYNVSHTIWNNIMSFTIDIRRKHSLLMAAAIVFGELIRCDSPGTLPYREFIGKKQFNCLLITVCVPSVTREGLKVWKHFIAQIP